MENEFGAKMSLVVRYPDGERAYSLSVPNWDLSVEQLVREMFIPLAKIAEFSSESVAEWLEEAFSEGR